MAQYGSTPTPASSSVTPGFCAILPPATNRGGRFFYSTGFSLLELLLVLFIMGLMTATTMLMTGGVEDQSKYDETKRRMELIKRAIVGDPTRTVNGGPEISGFVADMGRLPECIAELLMTGAEVSPATDPKTYDSPCSGAPDIVEWHMDATTGLWLGWRGPYLGVIPESTLDASTNSYLAFRDGYGTAGNAAADYGWSFPSPAGGSQEFRSSSNGAPASAVIARNDYAVDVGSIKVRIENHRSTNTTPVGQLWLRFYFRDGGNAISAVDSDDGFVSIPALSGVPASNNFYVSDVILAMERLPMGVNAFVVMCDNGSGSASGVFTGDNSCPAIATSAVQPITIIPRMQIPQFLTWILR